MLLGPALRPAILGVQLGDTQPVFKRQPLAVADARTVLLAPKRLMAL